MPLAALAVKTIRDTNREVEIEDSVDDTANVSFELAVPKGHRRRKSNHVPSDLDDDQELDVKGDSDHLEYQA